MTTFIGLLGLVISLVLILLGGRVLWLTYFSAWEKIPIIELVASPSVHSRGIYGTTTYRPDVAYSYDYMGEHYTSRRLALFESELSGDLGEVVKLCDLLVAKSRFAFVNVRKPKLAVLLLRDAKGTISQAYALTLGGALVLVVFVGLFL